MVSLLNCCRTLLLLTVLTTAGELSQTGTTTNVAAQVYRDRVEPHWFAGNNKFWYRVALPGQGQEFVVVDAVAGTRRPAFDHERLARQLSLNTGEAMAARKLPFDSLLFSDDETSVQLSSSNAVWRCSLTTYEIVALPPDRQLESTNQPAVPKSALPKQAPARTAGESPDGRWRALVRGHNLALLDLKLKTEYPLTYDGNPDNSYARNFQRDRSIELEYEKQEPAAPESEVVWSPDSHRLVAIQTRPGTSRRVYLIESSPKNQLQPKLHSYPYLKPGDEVPIARPRLFDAESRREIPIDGTLFPNPWSIDDIRWSSDSSRFTFLYNQRGHQVLRVLAVAASDGTVTPVINEHSETFVDYSGKFYSHDLDDTNEIIWMSERDGWNHLYLYDSKSGLVKNQITRGDWVVREVELVDKEKRQIWFTAGGIRPGQDPYHIHYCRVGFDGHGLTILTEGDGNHRVQFSPDHRFFVDTWSRVDLPPINELRRSEDGALMCKLEETDIRELTATNWRPPDRFVAKGRDGVTDIHGIIHWPHVIDPGHKYPVIENIYAGPQDSFVPKSFHASSGEEELTRLGFIVVQIDGMGTSNRSKKFHDVCWRNLADAGLPDRILWMKAAASRFPQMDLDRVGIYGGSAGGQSALGALLLHGDFYRVGVADCGCHDNRMDKIWWNEQWMGWPVGPHYEEQSNVTLAKNLRGKLLLMVGELDRNVDPASTLQVVNALVKADKDFDLIVFPGSDHGAGSSAYGRRRRNDFFVRHLLAPAEIARP